MQLLQIIFEILILGLGLYIVSFKSYFTEKGKNLATLEDIEIITKKVEEIKLQIQKQQLVEKQKRDLKYNALLNSLTLIDSYYSHSLTPTPGQKIKPQHASTEEARKCHNDLILTAENVDIIEMFSLIMFGNNETNEPPTVILNRFRNMIRKDLGFGNEIPLNEERAWFGYFSGEKE